MANPAPTINQLNAFNATQGTTIDFNIIGGTELVRSNRIYIYDLSDNSLICTHLYVSTESIHELPPNTDGSIVYESGKSSADFVNGAQYYAQIQTFTDIAGTEGGSGLSVAKMFWCLVDPTLTITTIPSTISTTSYNVSATYNANTSVVSNIIQQYQFSLYSATGSLLQSSGVVVGSGTQQGTSTTYDISYNFTGLSVGSSYYVVVDITTTQGMSVSTRSSTFTVSIDTPTLGEATVVNNACDGYISVTSNLSGEYGGSGSGEIVSFETDSENVFTKLQVTFSPIQSGSGTPSPSNVRPISGHDEVDVSVVGKNLYSNNVQCISYASRLWENNSFGFSVTKTESGYKTNANNQFGFVAYLGYFEAGKTYTVSFSISGQSSSTTYSIRRTDTNVLPPQNADLSKGLSATTIASITSTGGTFTTDVDAYYWLSTYDSESTSLHEITLSNIQLELGSTATEYEPYVKETIHKDIEATYTPTVQENEPYQFKRTGDVGGDRESIELVGGSVAWNQLVNGNNGFGVYDATITQYDQLKNEFTVTLTTAGGGRGLYCTSSDITSIPIGHVCAVLFDAKGSAPFNIRCYLNGDNSGYTLGITTAYKQYGRITKTTAQNELDFYAKEYSANDIFNIKNIIVVDLTQLFGSTIADYIYSLEQANAGAGVAFFRKYFPKPYYPYDSGTIKSVEGVSAHKTVGFNAWDGEYQLGYYDTTTGEYVSVAPSSSWRCTKNAIKCLPNTTYYFKEPTGYTGSFGALLFYDISGNLVGVQASTVNLFHKTFTTPSNCYQMQMYANKGNFEGVTEPFCINLSWDGERNGEYEPYVEHSYPLDDSLTLRGLFQIENGKLKAYGDEYPSDGNGTERFMLVDLGSLNWTYYTSGTNPVFYASIDGSKTYQRGDIVSAICSKYVNYLYANDRSSLTIGLLDKTFSYIIGGTNICVRDDAYTDAATFKSAMNGVYLVCEKATPTQFTAEPFENIQEVTPNYGTEEFVTTSIVPVGNNTQYLTRDIYGGTLDLVSGVLTVTHAMNVYDGSESWAKDSDLTGGIHRFYLSDNTIKKYSDYSNVLLSNKCKAVNNYQYTGGVMDDDFAITAYSIFANNFNWAYIFSKTIDNVNDLKTWLSDEPLQFWYPLATPQTYQLTPQQIQTLVGVNNVWSEQGDVELSYHIPITNLLVKRQDVADVSGDWLTLYSQPITQASDMDFTFIDFTNQYGKTYKYALVPLLTQTQSGVEVEVEGGYTVSDEVQSVFDGVFIVDSTGSQKCKANVGYGNVDMNQTVGTITPIGAKYPVVITNSKNQYHNGSIYGTIVPDDYYFNGNLSRIDMVNKRSELEQFLTNKRAKIIKDWNGNIWLVMIMDNVSCTFNNNYGMGIVNFNTNWVEVGDPTNQEDLQATGLIDIGGV